MKQELKNEENNVLYELNRYVVEAQRRIQNAIINTHGTGVILDDVMLPNYQYDRISFLCITIFGCSGIEDKKRAINDAKANAFTNNKNGKISLLRLYLIDANFHSRVRLIPKRLVKEVKFWKEFDNILNEISYC